MINEYQGSRLSLYHFDLYRLCGVAELEDLGYEEYFYGEGAVIVEWAEKCEGLLPKNHLRIELRAKGKQSRCLDIFLPEEKAWRLKGIR